MTTRTRFTEYKFKTHEVIFTEGSAQADLAYLLKEGRVELSKKVQDKKRVLSVIQPVTIFGEMALILPEHKRTASAVAKSDVLAVGITRDNFLEFVKQAPPIMQSVLDVIVSRLKTATERSMLVPNLFSGMCSVFEFCGQHGATELDYQRIIATLGKTFFAEEENAEKAVNLLLKTGLAEMVEGKDGRFIRLKEIENLPTKAEYALTKAKRR